MLDREFYPEKELFALLISISVKEKEHG